MKLTLLRPFLLSCCFVTAISGQALQDPTLGPRRTLARYDQELRFIDFMMSLERQRQRKATAFRHVNVVDALIGSVVPNMRVDIVEGRIAGVAGDGLIEWRSTACLAT